MRKGITAESWRAYETMVATMQSVHGMSYRQAMYLLTEAGVWSSICDDVWHVDIDTNGQDFSYRLEKCNCTGNPDQEADSPPRGAENFQVRHDSKISSKQGRK